MGSKSANYYAKQDRPYSDQQQQIVYSFNGEERSILGFIEERGDSFYLYEYRGKLVGTEFFIAFSKKSTSYKLIDVKEEKK